METIKKILKKEFDTDYSIKEIFVFKAGCVLLQIELLYPVYIVEIIGL